MTMQLETADAAADNQPEVKPAAAAGGGAGLAPSARTAFEPFGGGASGAALPSSVTGQLSSAYGADVSGMRVHTDGGANKAADKMGAEAFSYGNDVYFGTGQYQPGTAKGDYVIAHEAAHVAQQGGGVHPKLADAVAQGEAEIGPESDPAETDAAAAADAVTRGGSHTVSRGAAKIRRFSAGGHAKQTEAALATMGLSDKEDKYGNSEVKTARSGNWERDLSQVVLPATKDLGLLTPIMPVLNIISMKDFGRPINLAEFGSYDPVEHMDNPADLRADGAFKQGGSVEGNLDADIKQHETANGTVDNAVNGGPDSTGWAGKNPDGSDVDPRYAEAAKGLDFKDGIDDKSSIAFSVDSSGIPVYMTASKQMLKAQLHNSMRLGRKGNDGRGPRLFSSAVHIMQDYYAHSNFSEIAINCLLREGVVEVADEHGEIQHYDYKQHGKRVLNTGVHANKADGVAVEDANLTVGPDGKKREVMMTGSFNLTDTAASVMEEVKEKWIEINPFKQGSKEASKMVGACLDYMQLKDAGKVNTIGKKSAELFNGVVKFLGGLAPTAAKVVEVGGGYVAEATKGAGKVASGGLGVLNWANSQLGGSDNYFANEQKAVEKTTNDAGNAVDSSSKELAQGVKRLGEELGKISVQFDGVHGLRNAQMWLSEAISPVEWLAKLAEKILPDPYGKQAHDEILAAGNNFKAFLEDHLGSWWNEVIKDGVTKIDEVIGKLRAATNLKNQKQDGKDGQKAGPSWLPEWAQKGLGAAQGWGQKKFGAVGDLYDEKDGVSTPKAGTGIGPSSYTPPSHTQIAKDHGDHAHGAKDGHADGVSDPASTQEKGDAKHDPKKHGGSDHSEGDDKHGAVHVSAWLAPIAEGMAHAATRAIGDGVAAGWDALNSMAADSGDPNPAPAYPTTKGNPKNEAAMGTHDKTIDAIVDTWFAHPEDCRATWEGFIKAQLKSARMGAALLKRISEDLSAAKPGAPTQPDDTGAEAAVAGAQTTDSIGPTKAPVAKPDQKDHYAEKKDQYGPEVHEADDHDHDHDHDHKDDKGHGAAGHQCTAKCNEHTPHGADNHACGKGCDHYAPHGNDAHQCTVHCETKAA